MHRGTWLVWRPANNTAEVLPDPNPEKQVGLFVEETGMFAFFNKATGKTELVSVHDSDGIEFVQQVEPVPDFTRMMVQLGLAQARIDAVTPRMFMLLERELLAPA